MYQTVAREKLDPAQSKFVSPGQVQRCDASPAGRGLAVNEEGEMRTIDWM